MDKKKEEEIMFSCKAICSTWLTNNKKELKDEMQLQFLHNGKVEDTLKVHCDNAGKYLGQELIDIGKLYDSIRLVGVSIEDGKDVILGEIGVTNNG
jgi:hypothetical protein